MTATISRLYNNYADAREAVRNLEAAGVGHKDINILASNADNWYSSDRKEDAREPFPDTSSPCSTTHKKKPRQGYLCRGQGVWGNQIGWRT